MLAQERGRGQHRLVDIVLGHLVLLELLGHRPQLFARLRLLGQSIIVGRVIISRLTIAGIYLKITICSCFVSNFEHLYCTAKYSPSITPLIAGL